MKRKAKECIKELWEHYYDITTDTDKSDFKDGYAYGIKVAIVIIKRIFNISE